MDDKETEPTNATPLLLEAPPQNQESRKLEVGGASLSLYDELGPTIVSSDGTLSRIGNWKELFPHERENVLRVLGKRNATRLDERKKAVEEEERKAGELQNPENTAAPETEEEKEEAPVENEK